jgi:HPt (histidine-containing phosphotransfer) domain-containing protein
LKTPHTVSVDKDIFDLAETFLQNRRGQTRGWRDALDAGDLHALRRVGHEIKGTAGAFGFGDLSAIGAALEQSAVDGDLERAGEMTEQMIDLLDRLAVVPL